MLLSGCFGATTQANTRYLSVRGSRDWLIRCVEPLFDLNPTGVELTQFDFEMRRTLRPRFTSGRITVTSVIWWAKAMGAMWFLLLQNTWAVRVSVSLSKPPHCSQLQHMCRTPHWLEQPGARVCEGSCALGIPVVETQLLAGWIWNLQRSTVTKVE